MTSTVGTKRPRNPKRRSHFPHKDSCLIEGLPAIAKHLDRSINTIYRWIHLEAFPAAKLPGGCWATTQGLIDSWLLARNHQFLELIETKERRDKFISLSQKPKEGEDDGK